MARTTEAAGDSAEAATAEETVPQAAEYVAAQAAEYSQWVAAEDIYVGTARAYREGDPVPASNVALHEYDKHGLVQKVS